MLLCVFKVAFMLGVGITVLSTEPNSGDIPTYRITIGVSRTQLVSDSAPLLRVGAIVDIADLKLQAAEVQLNGLCVCDQHTSFPKLTQSLL